MATSNNWPKTSDKEFSKRMFKRFMCAFFAHAGLTLGAEIALDLLGLTNGQPTTILTACIPIYSSIFLGVLVKAGTENVFKGKAINANTTTTTSASGKSDEAPNG